MIVGTLSRYSPKLGGQTANNVTFGLDLRILLRTVITVFSRRDLYTNDDMDKFIDTVE